MDQLSLLRRLTQGQQNNPHMMGLLAQMYGVQNPNQAQISQFNPNSREARQAEIERKKKEAEMWRNASLAASWVPYGGLITRILKPTSAGGMGGDDAMGRFGDQVTGASRNLMGQEQEAFGGATNYLPTVAGAQNAVNRIFGGGGGGNPHKIGFGAAPTSNPDQAGYLATRDQMINTLQNRWLQQFSQSTSRR